MNENSQSAKRSNDKPGAALETITRGVEVVAETVGRLVARTLPEPDTTNAVTMLKADHTAVKHLFEDFEAAEEEETKGEIVKTTLRELTVHAALEEEIVYPAIRALEDSDEHQEQMDEAFEEHHAVKLLIAELAAIGSEDERYDAKFKVLAEMVRHHIREEEHEILPKAKGSLDLHALGQQMAMRKAELLEGNESHNDGSRRTRSAGRSRSARKRSSRRGHAA